MSDEERTFRERLHGRPESVARARRLLRSVGEALPTDVVETAELLLSELVTNAVVHAGTAIDVAVTVRDGTGLRVEVGDRSPHGPSPRHFEDTAGTGRGLRLVGDLADAWGVESVVGGKTVWFVVTSYYVETAVGDTGPHATPREADPDAVTVELVDFPLELHARWLQSSSALLREYLLTTLGDEDMDAQLAAHADCTAAMALLAEGIPEPPPVGGPGGPPEELRETVRLVVPTEAVPHFIMLDETLDRAVALAESDATLTPPTDPETRRFRRWLCRQVAGQSDGAPPVPWRG